MCYGSVQHIVVVGLLLRRNFRRSLELVGRGSVSWTNEVSLTIHFGVNYCVCMCAAPPMGVVAWSMAGALLLPFLYNYVQSLWPTIHRSFFLRCFVVADHRSFSLERTINSQPHVL